MGDNRDLGEYLMGRRPRVGQHRRRVGPASVGGGHTNPEDLDEYERDVEREAEWYKDHPKGKYVGYVLHQLEDKGVEVTGADDLTEPGLPAFIEAHMPKIRKRVVELSNGQTKARDIVKTVPLLEAAVRLAGRRRSPVKGVPVPGSSSGQYDGNTTPYKK
jgi:hypothetical protein